MIKKVFDKGDKSVIRIQCGMKFDDRWSEIAEHVKENSDKSCLSDYVRGAALTLSYDVAVHFAEEYSNAMLNDVCALLKEMDFFKSDEGVSEACMEEQFRKKLLGVE